ncbi:MAG: NifB/NifX family molybdenum-iron cluster-binding protein [Bradyrhizobium sp.]
MLVAIASQNFRTVTSHAGMTRRFMIFEVQPDREPEEINRLDLPRGQSIHEHAGNDPHPLDYVDVVIAGSAGPGFVDRMASHGVKAVATAETDPVQAIAKFLAGTLPPPLPKVGEGGCSCNCQGTH